MGIFRIGRFIPFQYQYSDLLYIFGKKNRVLLSHKAVQKERPYNFTLMMQVALKRLKSAFLYSVWLYTLFFKSLYFYTPKKTQGVRKNFLIFTVNLQFGERNYLFISVTNRYGILIFLGNVVEKRKKVPLIYKPKNQASVPNAVGRVSRPTYSECIPLLLYAEKITG